MDAGYRMSGRGTPAHIARLGVATLGHSIAARGVVMLASPQ
jgi:hypothetical protein